MNMVTDVCPSPQTVYMKFSSAKMCSRGLSSVPGVMFWLLNYKGFIAVVSLSPHCSLTTAMFWMGGCGRASQTT